MLLISWSQSLLTNVWAFSWPSMWLKTGPMGNDWTLGRGIYLADGCCRCDRAYLTSGAPEDF